MTGHEYSPAEVERIVRERDQCSGYANAETFAVIGWLDNDAQRLPEVHKALRLAAIGRNPLLDEAEEARRAGAVVRDYVEDWREDVLRHHQRRYERDVRMVADLGSLFRVNWYEVGAHYMDDLQS